MGYLKRGGVAVAAAAAAFGLTNVPAEAEVNVTRWECEVSVAADALPRAEEPLVVQASYTEAIGEEVTAVVDEESGIRVVAVTTDEEEPQTVRLTLDTSAAAAGSWSVTLNGEGGQCTGTVVVAGGEPDVR